MCVCVGGGGEGGGGGGGYSIPAFKLYSYFLSVSFGVGFGCLKEPLNEK